jgi:hypothetical protein
MKTAIAFKEKYSAEMPSWASFDLTPEQYHGILRECKVDERAGRSLFNLATFGTDGRLYSNQVVSVLLKKLTDGTMSSIRNPSAFVQTACLKARHELCTKYGMDTWKGELER